MPLLNNILVLKWTAVALVRSPASRKRKSEKKTSPGEIFIATGNHGCVFGAKKWGLHEQPA
jgi:hypothetical protein